MSPLCQDCEVQRCFLVGGRQQNVNEKLLHFTLTSKHDECVKTMLESGADVNWYDDDMSNTALMVAAEVGYVNGVNILLTAGAGVNKTNGVNHTALMSAVSFGNAHIVGVLLTSGADVNKADDFEETALIKAAGSGTGKCVNALIEAGADVNKIDLEYNTALVHAIIRGHPDCAYSILNAGAEVNVLQYEKYTLLYTITFDILQGYRRCWEESEIMKRVRCAKVLLKYDVKINVSYFASNNALTYFLTDCLKEFSCKDFCMLLFAAGERIEGRTFKRVNYDGSSEEAPVPEYLANPDLKLTLKHMCREAIRKHLLDLDPHQNLFGRIPRLKCPSLIKDYLLYNVDINGVDSN